MLKNALKKAAPLIAAFGFFAGLVAMSMVSAMHPPAELAAMQMAATPPIGSLTESMAGYNTGGDHVYSEMYINDGTGVVITPLDGGLLTALAGAPLTVGQEDGSGAITANATTGLFTIAKPGGAGKVVLELCLNNFFAGNTAKTHNVVLMKNGSAVTAAPIITKTEVVDAGNQGTAGCLTTIQEAVLADTFGFSIRTNGATAEATTTRSGNARIFKIRQ